MKINKIIKNVYEVQPKIFKDERGFFYESFHLNRYKEVGIQGPWLQDNNSKSNKGDIRGLHFQYPKSQGKLITVIYGSIFDVIIDVRKKSPTFGKWFSLELNDEKNNQLWVPPGFAHGFQVLSKIALVNYKCSLNYWSQKDEKIILFNDPDINIKWPLKVNKISEKDKKALPLKNIKKLPDN